MQIPTPGDQADIDSDGDMKQLLLVLYARARRGNVSAMRALLELKQKKQRQSFDVAKLKSLADVQDAHMALPEAVARGEISARDGERVSRMLNHHGEALKRSVLEAKLLFAEGERNEDADF